MLRYCVNCKKDFEFAPLAVSGKEDLICPECGGIIGKNSRHPADNRDSDNLRFYSSLSRCHPEKRIRCASAPFG